ncbi:MAG: amidase, partial [Pseudomonadales bacterium]
TNSLEDRSLAELSRMLDSGELTSVTLVGYYLERIKDIDQQPGATNAILEVNPDALSIASARDAVRAEGKSLGDLDGIPIVVKDNIDTADAMHTTAGSFALADSRPAGDAFLIERLRAAGAVILAKSNLSAWANIRSSRSVSGWSPRGGLTRNPHALDRSASGSSSGSGVAVAADFCAGAIGTETSGSIISPSSANGIVGLKPTVGLVSRTGIIPISHSQDTAGPMTRTVEDAAIMLNALAAEDGRDSATRDVDSRRPPDYTKFLDPNGLRGARIGVDRRAFGRHPAVAELANDAIRTLRDLGAEVIDSIMIEPTDDLRRDSFQLLLWELKNDMASYLETRRDQSPRTLSDLIEYNSSHADREMVFFGQETFLQAEEKGTFDDEIYLKALENVQRQSRDEGIDKAMSEHALDALVAPSSAPAWSIDLVNGDARTGGPNSAWYPAMAGYPHITVPMGDAFGLPVGLSFYAGAWQEARLIELAYAYEQATLARAAPTMLTSLKLG